MRALVQKLDQRLSEASDVRSLLLLFLLFWIVAVAVYFRASNAELIDDGFAGLMKFKDMGWAAFPQSFGFTSLYYVHDLVVLGVYYIVGKSSLGWFWVMITLHCLNAVLAYIVFRKFYAVFNINFGALIAFCGGVLFLLSPYQTENVVWAATLHYSVALTIFFTGCWLVLRMVSTGTIAVTDTVLLLVLFIVSLLTLEISLIFPFAWSCLLLPAVLSGKTTLKIRDILTQVMLPFLMSIGLYFIMTKLIKGHWIPHYGATHLQNNSLQNYSSSVARYILKLLGFVHFTEYDKREFIYGLCAHWKIALTIQLGAVAVLYFLLRKFKTNDVAAVFVSLICLALLLLFPSLQMYFMFLFTPENDRLSYFFSIAVYQLIPFLFFQLSAYAGLAVVMVYLLPGLYFLNKQVIKWHEAGVLHQRCVQSFTWTEAPHVYILNAPANYNGAYAFRNNERLPYALNFFKDYKQPERIHQVLSSAYSSLQDSTLVTVVNDSTLRVQLVTNGGWLMNEFYGAVDYTSEEFNVD